MLDKLENVNGVVITPAKWIFIINGLVFTMLLVVLPVLRILNQGFEFYLHSNFFLIHIMLFILITVYFFYLYSQKTVLTDDGIYRQSLSLRGLAVKYVSLDDIEFWNEADLCVELTQKSGEIFKVPLLSFSNNDREKFKLWLRKTELPNK